MPRVTNKVSDAQIAGLAAAQGLSGRALVVAVAVALAESDGDASVNGPNVTTNWGNGPFRTHAVGLWQILLGPGRPNEVALRNPTTNAQWMKKLSSGGKNWGPWEAYTNGRYLRYWSRAQKAANNPSAQPPGTNDDGSVDQAISLNPLEWADAASDFFEFITDPVTWLRFAMFIGGGALLAMGLFMLSGQAERATQAAKMAVNIIPQGRALKAATAVKAAA
jgi:hypothetical protein